MRENERSGKGRFVNYDHLPDAMWETILPHEFDILPTRDMIEKMSRVTEVYSKGRGSKANEGWKDDSAKKQNAASQTIQDAVHMFLDRPYKRMEDLSHT